MVPSRTLYVGFAIVAIALCLFASFGPALEVLLGCLAFPLAWIVISKSLRHTLVCESIALSPNGILEREFDVTVSETYELFLEFEKQGHPDAELRALIGFPKSGASTGVAVPVRWMVTDAITGKVTVSGERASTAVNSWSGRHIQRFLDQFALPRGHFLFRGEVTRDVSSLRGINARLRLCFEPTHGHSWRNAASFLLAFISYYVAIPVAVFCAIVLALRSFAA